MPVSLPSTLRSLLSALNRHPLWSARRKVWGHPVMVPSADRHLYAALHQWGFMGADDRRFYEKTLRPGMAVLDVGANIGLFTTLFARLVGPTGTVYSFEPAPEIYRALKASCALAGATNITTFPYGLGEADEDRLLRRSPLNSGDSRVAADGGAGEVGGDRIALRRGDGVLPPTLQVDFIKIDVQGWELPALKGLRGVIDRSPRLQIYFEFWPAGLRGAGTEPRALLRYLAGCGLNILRPLSGGGWAPAGDLAQWEKWMDREPFINLRAVRPGVLST